MVRPTWGRSFAVSGKMPQRNTRRASGKPISRLRETLATVARPCSAEGYESRRDGRLKHAETPAVRERPPPKTALACTHGLSGRSLPGSFLAGRPGGPEGRRGVARRLANRHASLTGKRGDALGWSTRGRPLPLGSVAQIEHTGENRASYSIRRDRIVLPCWERLPEAAGNNQAAQQELAPGWGTRAG